MLRILQQSISLNKIIIQFAPFMKTNQDLQSLSSGKMFFKLTICCSVLLGFVYTFLLLFNSLLHALHQIFRILFSLFLSQAITLVHHYVFFSNSCHYSRSFRIINQPIFAISPFSLVSCIKEALNVYFYETVIYIIQLFFLAR